MKIPDLCQACREGRAGGVVRHDIGLKGNDSKRGVGQREGDNLKWPQRKFWLEKKDIVYANILWVSLYYIF